MPGPANTEERAHYLPARVEAVEVGPIDGHGRDADQHLVGLRNGFGDFLDVHHAGRPVAVADGCSHTDDSATN
jgi:hypothetical protein